METPDSLHATLYIYLYCMYNIPLIPKVELNFLGLSDDDYHGNSLEDQGSHFFLEVIWISKLNGILWWGPLSSPSPIHSLPLSLLHQHTPYTDTRLSRKSRSNIRESTEETLEYSRCVVNSGTGEKHYWCALHTIYITHTHTHTFLSYVIQLM